MLPGMLPKDATFTKTRRTPTFGRTLFRCLLGALHYSAIHVHHCWLRQTSLSEHDRRWRTPTPPLTEELKQRLRSGQGGDRRLTAQLWRCRMTGTGKGTVTGASPCRYTLHLTSATVLPDTVSASHSLEINEWQLPSLSRHISHSANHALFLESHHHNM